MTSADEILEELRSLGVEVIAEGGRLRWRPREVVPPAMRQLIVDNKEALIVLLTGQERTAGGPHVICEPPASTPGRVAHLDDQRHVWILHENGYPEKVFSMDRIPPGATYWCQEGDKRWQPIQRTTKTE